MTNKYKKKNKEKLQREACEKYQNLFEEEKSKRPYKDIKILLKEKKKKSVSIIGNVIKIFLRSKSRS